MVLTDKLRSQIDAMSYADLLRAVRFAPVGDERFQGEVGDYWLQRMRTLRNQDGGQAMHVAASKQIGH